MMAWKHTWKKSFIPKKIRLTILVISLLTLFFIYAFKKLSEVLEPPLLFILISVALIALLFLGLLVAVTIFITHRFIGPFDRLKIEMDNIKPGHYNKRLRLRKKDNKHLRSFITNVDNVLGEFEKIHFSKKELLKNVESELSGIISVSEEEGSIKGKQKESIIALQKKIGSMLE